MESNYRKLDTPEMAKSLRDASIAHNLPLLWAAADRLEHLLKELGDATACPPRRIMAHEIPYANRPSVYDRALAVFGKTTQLTVALEELSEAQKEICKMLRGDGDLHHLAEEIADALIMLEQVQRIFGISEEMTRAWMSQKVSRLQDKVAYAESHRYGDRERGDDQ